MVSNCNKFHWVEDDENCSAILELYSITLAQFAQWNPAAKSTCSGLWSRTVCDSISLIFLIHCFL